MNKNKNKIKNRNENKLKQKNYFKFIRKIKILSIEINLIKTTNRKRRDSEMKKKTKILT